MFIQILMILSTIPFENQLRLEAEYNLRVKRLAAQGYPVSLEDFEKQHALPEGVKNAADYYIEAFSCYHEPNEAEREYLPLRGKYGWSDDALPFPQEVMDAIESSLMKNRKTLNLLDRASFIEHCHWPGTWNNGSFSNEHLRQIKNSASLLCERNLFLAQKNKLNDLRWSTQSLIALSNSLSQQSFELDFLVTIAMKAMVVRNFEIILGQVELAERDLRLYQKQLQKSQDPDLMRRTMVNVRCGLIQYWKLSIGRQAIIEDEYMPQLKYLRLLATLSGIKQKDQLYSLDYYERFINALELPLHRQPEALQSIEGNTSGCASALSIYRVVLPMSYSHGFYLRVLGGLRCAETAMAIEQYRLAQDELPESLEELVPVFMEAVPLEPFDGEPLRYIRHEEGGYRVYGIGEDGVDNGGLSREQMAEKTDDKNPDEYDWPFTVRR